MRARICGRRDLGTPKIEISGVKSQEVWDVRVIQGHIIDINATFALQIC